MKNVMKFGGIEKISNEGMKIIRGGGETLHTATITPDPDSLDPNACPKHGAGCDGEDKEWAGD